MIAGSDDIVFRKILTPQLYPIYLLCVLYFYTTKYLHGVVNRLSRYKSVKAARFKSSERRCSNTSDIQLLGSLTVAKVPKYQWLVRRLVLHVLSLYTIGIYPENRLVLDKKNFSEGKPC